MTEEKAQSGTPRMDKVVHDNARNSVPWILREALHEGRQLERELAAEKQRADEIEAVVEQAWTDKGVAAFQRQVEAWMQECFGPDISGNCVERNHRFLEEALELVQACDCTASEAHRLVDYVFGRPIGERQQEAGGVMITLAALCSAQLLDMMQAGQVELARVWTKIDVIRAKQTAKPKHSLPDEESQKVRK